MAPCYVFNSSAPDAWGDCCETFGVAPKPFMYYALLTVPVEVVLVAIEAADEGSVGEAKKPLELAIFAALTLASFALIVGRVLTADGAAECTSAWDCYSGVVWLFTNSAALLTGLTASLRVTVKQHFASFAFVASSLLCWPRRLFRSGVDDAHVTFGPSGDFALAASAITGDNMSDVRLRPEHVVAFGVVCVAGGVTHIVPGLLVYSPVVLCVACGLALAHVARVLTKSRWTGLAMTWFVVPLLAAASAVALATGVASVVAAFVAIVGTDAAAVAVFPVVILVLRGGPACVQRCTASAPPPPAPSLEEASMPGDVGVADLVEADLDESYSGVAEILAAAGGDRYDDDDLVAELAALDDEEVDEGTADGFGSFASMSKMKKTARTRKPKKPTRGGKAEAAPALGAAPAPPGGADDSPSGYVPTVFDNYSAGPDPALAAGGLIGSGEFETKLSLSRKQAPLPRLPRLPRFAVIMKELKAELKKLAFFDEGGNVIMFAGAALATGASLLSNYAALLFAGVSFADVPGLDASVRESGAYFECQRRYFEGLGEFDVSGMLGVMELVLILVSVVILLAVSSNQLIHAATAPPRPPPSARPRPSPSQARVDAEKPAESPLAPKADDINLRLGRLDDTAAAIQAGLAAALAMLATPATVAYHKLIPR